jgi:hypothetical protein
MIFRSRRNPVDYLAEIHVYVDDLQRITLLRNKCEPGEELNNYNRMIHTMQEALIFMNTISKRDRTRLTEK